MTIGQRADECIKKRASETGTTIKHQLEKLDVRWETVKNWRRKTGNPGSLILAEMYKQGYDVIYILSGEHEKNDGGDLCV